MHTGEMTIPPPSDTALQTDPFEKQYIELRQKENWLCSDEELKRLPDTAASHPHYAEWKIRKQSAQKLTQYLRKKKKPLRILEAGCGNGWLAHQLSHIPGSTVAGTDINTNELQQARRVFGQKTNLVFTEGDIRHGILKKTRYDIIVFAASIQYFPWLGEIIHAAFELATPGGEIHIIDSPLYFATEIKAAKERSAAYFQQLGFPEMSRYYFHHTRDELLQFNYTMLYNPYAWQRQLLPTFITGTKNPFPWISITNS